MLGTVVQWVNTRLLTRRLVVLNTKNAPMETTFDNYPWIRKSNRTVVQQAIEKLNG